MKTDTEDPNIATLRTYLGGKGLPEYEAAWSALDALAQTLAELRAFAAFGALAYADAAASAPDKSDDPNIATLRDYVRQGSVNGTTEQQDEEALRALQALASTLAERDRRIAALEANEAEWRDLAEGLSDSLAAKPPAPAPGELAEGLRKLRELIDKNAEINDSEGQQNRREVTAVCDAAESWQRLQWRPASEAPLDETVIVLSGEAEIDANELEWSIANTEAYLSVRLVDDTAKRYARQVIAAARAHLASLRAPKGELEEALAAFAAGKDNFEAAWRPGAQRMTLRWTTDWETHEGAYFGQTPHAVSGDGSDYHTALAAALSRARGEGT